MARLRRHRVTIVSDGSETAISMYCQPGAARLQVTAPDNVWFVRPPVCFLCGSRMKLITVGGEDKGVVGVLADTERDKTHCQSPWM